MTKSNISYTEKYQKHILCSFVYKVNGLMINLVNNCSLQGGKMELLDSWKQFLKSMKKRILQKSDKKLFQ